MLTPKQHTLLVFIDERLNADGVSPSYDEMKDALGLASKSGIHRLITALEERGFIRRLPNKARALEVLVKPKTSPKAAKPKPLPEPANDTIALPLVGKIAAGTPISAIQDSDTFVNVPAAMATHNDCFALTVEGESMTGIGIMDGDTVVLRRADTARNNEIVVALVDQEEATLKRLRKTGSQVELIAENPDFETRVFGPDRVEVQGVLVGLLRTYH